MGAKAVTIKPSNELRAAAILAFAGVSQHTGITREAMAYYYMTMPQSCDMDEYTTRELAETRSDRFLLAAEIAAGEGN